MVLQPGFDDLIVNTTDLVFNHTPAVQGYVSAYVEVYGMNIIISLMIVQTLLLAAIFYNTVKRGD
jgi:hypothetical protein